MSAVKQYLWQTIRAATYGVGFDVHGFMEQVGGTLDGQTLKCYIDTFETLGAAQAAFPAAKMGSRWTDPVVSLRHLPDNNDDECEEN